MRELKIFLVIIFANCVFMNAQNQLPIENGSLEITSGSNFIQWTNQANNGGDVNFSIATENLITGSTKALKSTITTLGSKGWHVSSSNNYAFEVLAGAKYSVSFYAKTENAETATLKLVFQSEVGGSYQGVNIDITSEWTRYHHTFTVSDAANLNQVKLWYMNAGVVYYIDELSVVPDKYIAIDTGTTFQTVDGFGAGIKRRTEDLYALSTSLRETIESYAFQDLEVNMIRFFVYHDLEPSDDVWDWDRYDSDPNKWKTRYIGEALNNAFSLSVNGFDHIIGNCNSAPGWMKKNGSHKRASADEDVLLNTLKTGYEAEYSEFLVTFLQGMKSRYNIDVTAISPTNEPDYLNTYESMNSTPTELIGMLNDLDASLDAASLSSVQIVAAECGLVAPKSQNNLTAINSATTYTNDIFTNASAKAAVDVIGTHTYFDSNHDTNWANLKTAADTKPVWVTESANLSSTDMSMTDAANYVKWMIRGFNEGGLTGYMAHLFYEEHIEEKGSSALVLWDSEGDVILPRRYYIMKHFANLVKKGYQLISSEVIQGDLMVASFQSEDASKIVVQIFSESGAAQQLSLDTPIGVVNATHYSTSDAVDMDFSMVNDLSFQIEDRYVSFEVSDLSMHSIEYNVDNSSLNIATLEPNASQREKALLYPNPVTNKLTVDLPNRSRSEVCIRSLTGALIARYEFEEAEAFSIDVSHLSKNIYLIEIFQSTPAKTCHLKFVKD